MGRLATSPVSSRASPTLHSRGQNQQWPASGQIGYITRARWGVPKTSTWGTKSKEAHEWA